MQTLQSRLPGLEQGFITRLGSWASCLTPSVSICSLKNEYKNSIRGRGGSKNKIVSVCGIDMGMKGDSTRKLLKQSLI